MKGAGSGHTLTMATPSASRPPDLAEVQRWVLDNPAQLRLMRGSLLDSIECDGYVAGDVADRMLIVATELATNALKYGLPPTIVRLCRNDQDFVIDVVDHNPADQPAEPSPNGAASGGLGLKLARAMALDVGWYATATAKHVWARFPVADPS